MPCSGGRMPLVQCSLGGMFVSNFLSNLNSVVILSEGIETEGSFCIVSSQILVGSVLICIFTFWRSSLSRVDIAADSMSICKGGRFSAASSAAVGVDFQALVIALHAILWNLFSLAFTYSLRHI